MPRFHLRQFSDDKERLFAFDKKTNKSFATNCRDAGGERYFYDIPELDKATGGVQTVEAHFRRIEEDAAPYILDIITRLESNTFVSITPVQRRHMSFFLANQIVRTKEFRKKTIELQQKVYEEVAKRIIAVKAPELSGIPFKTKLRDGADSLLHAATIFDRKLVLKLASALYGHIWVIGVNLATRSFYTSDHPVTVRPHLQHPYFGMAGYGSKGVEVCYPLSSRHILCMLERSHFEKLSAVDGQTMNLPDDQDITYYNALQVYSSYRCVYCENDDFELARRVCVKEPLLRDPDRDRIRAG